MFILVISTGDLVYECYLNYIFIDVDKIVLEENEMIINS